jgi:hypothetical protein
MKNMSKEVDEQLRKLAFVSALGGVLSDDVNTDEDSEFMLWYNAEQSERPDDMVVWEPFEGYDSNALRELIEDETAAKLALIQNAIAIIESQKAADEQKIVVIMEGGSVRNLLSDRDGVAVAFIEYDKHAPSDSSVLIPQDGGGESVAYVSTFTPGVIDADRVNELYDAANEAVSVDEMNASHAKAAACLNDWVLVRGYAEMISAGDHCIDGRVVGITGHHIAVLVSNPETILYDVGYVIPSARLKMEQESLATGDFITINVKGGASVISAATAPAAKAARHRM